MGLQLRTSCTTDGPAIKQAYQATGVPEKRVIDRDGVSFKESDRRSE